MISAYTNPDRTWQVFTIGRVIAYLAGEADSDSVLIIVLINQSGISRIAYRSTLPKLPPPRFAVSALVF